MAKIDSHRSAQHVVWHLEGDAMRPKEAPWGFVIQNPVQRTLMPGQRITVNLGVSSNMPLVAWVSRDKSEYIEAERVIAPGQSLSVSIENRSKHMPMVIDDREVLLNVHPLAWTGTSEVG